MHWNNVIGELTTGISSLRMAMFPTWSRCAWLIRTALMGIFGY